jgi:serine/threonine protein kinase/tetratricopeptide (TPR) repeat protein
MKCKKCQFENPQDSAFCNKCGTKLSELEGLSVSVTKTIETKGEGLTRGTTFAGRYEIIELLGTGGMGKVYRAFDNKVKEEIAIKLLKPEISQNEKIIERFSNEIRLSRKITHKNVCRMHDLNEEGGTQYITMEYVAGEDLKSFIRRVGHLPPKKAISIGRQVCEGLAEAHSLGVIHRDLKPQNIMVDKSGNPKIMDFGIARSLKAEGITGEGAIIGTPEYMSPEQVEGKETDQRSDIYSMGVVLYEMLIGKVPFEGESTFSIALKHRDETPPHPRELNPELSPELSAIILKCMAKEKERRYQSALELIRELDALEKGTEITAAETKPQVPAFLEEKKAVKEEIPVFVARESELERLDTFLERSLLGEGQVVFITGEAGCGKTALIQEFARRTQETHSDLVVASGKCNAHTGIGDPYSPFMEMLALLMGDVETRWAAGMISQEHAQRLWSLMPQTIKALLDCGPDLINIFVPGAPLLSRAEAFAPGSAEWQIRLKRLVERKAMLPPDSSLQQSDLFEQYTRLLVAVARERPLLLVLDDLQWIDAGSASLLFHLCRRMKGSRILIAGSYRPDEVALGRGDGRHPLETVVHELRRDLGDIELEVGKTEAREFVDAYIDTEPNRLDNQFRETIFKQTKGHPLFTVELLKEIQNRDLLIKDEQGRWIQGPDLDWNALPARVDAVIEERISRLNEDERETLTLASVEGEEFTAEVLAQLQDVETRKLIRILSGELDRRHHLVAAKGMRHLKNLHLSLYLFRHMLFQRYLYNNLDEVERTHLHADVGKTLENLYGEQNEEVSVQLARHFQEAGVLDKAIEYLHKAGKRAVHLSANEEAIAHYKKALELLERLPETPERVQKEVALQLDFVVPVSAKKGYGAPEVRHAIFRARELCEQVRETPQFFTTLVQIATLHAFVQAEYRTALDYQGQIIKIAEQTGDPLQKAISSYTTIWSLLNIGELTKTVEHAKEMNALYDPDQHGFLAYIFGFDLGVINRGFGSWALWFLGYPNQARKDFDLAMEHAYRSGHPHTIAFFLVGACEMDWFLGDKEAGDRHLEELARISDEKGFVYWQAHAVFYEGEKLALEGKVEEGIAQMRQGLDMIKATGIQTCFTRLLARMADACLKTGQIDEGLTAIDEASEVRCKFDERYMEAEHYRLKGELLLKKGGSEEEAMKLFEQALEVSRKQQAKSLELRAMMSMSRLLQNQGKKREAHKLLNETYSWFTEGFDTADLKEAKTLLEELESSQS